ncbi:DNA-binding transcriptional ArsR family regulator [Streptosporangium becharense]|uniref:DNA-binding transcriptional ArsR family regulator n=1 Tax=Streptosporangium becharense TaxID=1816182 RepID=A0A7W9IKC8_9ACTN|nr:winged helix-turn-helix domain-containing protein [Streptosporangium becharense]MBB2911848.1 DNA-binding transcriptional ArsR family regulator [Streptosporangium becharense]MBB5822334.1 DNA-binding transcriptional ArsR family regulator [Streptosporangium becharense]
MSSDLVGVLAALANPQRLRLIASLAGGSNYVSQLARELELSRPLVHMHLRRLEEVGLVVGRMELSADGKAMRFFDVTPFAYQLTPEAIQDAVRTMEEK